MMWWMEMLYIAFGAFLGLACGKITQIWEQRSQDQREEKDILFDANDTLLDLGSLLRQIGFGDESFHEERVTLAHRQEISNLCNRLMRQAISLRRKDHRDVAVRITKIALDPLLRTDKNISIVLQDIQGRLNPEMIQRYGKEVANRPEEF